MLKILNAQQINAVDQLTISRQGLTSLELMERAALTCFNWIVQNLQIQKVVGVMVGPGNNGGDGLSIARSLHLHGCEVKVFTLGAGDSLSQDCRLQRDLCEKAGVPMAAFSDDIDTGKIDLWLDCILGTGLRRMPSGLYLKAINAINDSDAEVVSIDIPSGLPCEPESWFEPGASVKPDYTLTLELPKLSFLLPRTGRLVGCLVILPIGLDEQAIGDQASHIYWLQWDKVHSWLEKRPRFSHKGDYGRVGVLGGSMGMMGACLLASEAALRTGAGTVTSVAPEALQTVVHAHMPELMAMSRDQLWRDEMAAFRQNVTWLVGPGLGKISTDEIKKVLESSARPLVLDADALNWLGEDIKRMELVPEGSILTPHPKEFERMVGKWSSDTERMIKARAFCSRYGVVLVLKDAYTFVFNSEGDAFVSLAGNAGMATGGAGDVLSGIIVSLLAQGYQPIRAALLGVLLHGQAGDRAAVNKGMNALIASDIINHVWQGLS